VSWQHVQREPPVSDVLIEPEKRDVERVADFYQRTRRKDEFHATFVLLRQRSLWRYRTRCTMPLESPGNRPHDNSAKRS
jgi:hypothetical protein